jgi:protein-S-isoprenylcysteine O-methyltransferase Ste14
VNSTQNSDHPDIIAFPPLIFVACAIVSTLAHFVYPVRVMRYPLSLVIAVVLSISSACLAIWAVRTMKTAGTNVRPDRPALSIVKSGPYRFTRNPMYLSLCLFQLAIGFFLNGWTPVLCAVVLGVVLHFGVIVREETYLERKFGEQYLSLKRQVRRWL